MHRSAIRPPTDQEAAGVIQAPPEQIPTSRPAEQAAQEVLGSGAMSGRRWSGRRWSGRRWSGRRWSGASWGDGGS